MKAWVIIFILALGSCATSNKGIIDQASFEVVNFGLYLTQTEYLEKLDSSPTGKMSNSNDWFHLKTTTEVPAILNTRFGVEYQINSDQYDRVKLKFKWVPSTPIKSNTGKIYNELVYEKTKKTNHLQYAGYILSVESELVPNHWVLQILSDGILLYEKKFNVSEPSTNGTLSTN